MHILVVVTMILTIAAARDSPAPVSATNADTSTSDQSITRHHQIQMDTARGSLETSEPIIKHVPVFPLKITVMFPECLSAREEHSAVSDGTSQSKQFSYSNQDDVCNCSYGSATLPSPSTCFCNHCVVNTSQSTSVDPECCYVKRFLTSGCLNTGKLALRVLQQYITTESKFQNHNNSRVVLLPETTKMRELRQATCVLRSLALVYDWRMNYDAVQSNVVGDNDRHFDPDRYQRLLSSVEATLESMPEFLGAVSHLDAVGTACLDIMWAPVFAAALGRNHTAFELFLRKERSKLKKTLWTGLMFRSYLDPVVYFLLTLFGVLSNGSLLFMFVRYKEMQTQRNVLLLNLIVVDLMNLATVAPLYLLSKYCSPSLYTGEFGCRVFLCYRIIVRYNIEFSLVALTAQRYSAVTSRPLSDRTRAVFYILGVWVMSVVAALPHTVAFVLRDFSCFSFRKDPGEIDFLVDHVAMMLLSLTVPAVVFVLSVLMARRLTHSVREMPGESRQSFQKQGFARSRSARVVVALAVVFTFTHTPRAFWYGWVPWSEVDRQSAAFLWIDGVMNYLYYLNSGLNPCAMYFSCSTFRKMFRRCFFCLPGTYNTKDSNQSQRTQQFYIPQSCHL